MSAGYARVPHFLGLHALQALPLLALFVERRRSARSLVLGVGAAWLGLVVVTLAQALRGQPLLRPDAPTVAAALLAIGLGVAIARRRARPPAILTPCAWTPAGSSPR